MKDFDRYEKRYQAASLDTALKQAIQETDVAAYQGQTSCVCQVYVPCIRYVLAGLRSRGYEVSVAEGDGLTGKLDVTVSWLLAEKGET